MYCHLAAKNALAAQAKVKVVGNTIHPKFNVLSFMKKVSSSGHALSLSLSLYMLVLLFFNNPTHLHNLMPALYQWRTPQKISLQFPIVSNDKIADTRDRGDISAT